MRVVVKNSDGTETIHDGTKNVCLVIVDEKELEDVMGMLTMARNNPDAFHGECVLIIADKNNFTETEVFNMVDKSFQQTTPASKRLESNFEKVEFSFHRMRMENDVEGMRKLAEDWPDVYGLAVAEYIRNVYPNRQKPMEKKHVQYGPTFHISR